MTDAQLERARGEIARAEREASEKFPDALKVRGLWANGAPLVEVFTEPGRAFTWLPGWAR